MSGGDFSGKRSFVDLQPMLSMAFTQRGKSAPGWTTFRRKYNDFDKIVTKFSFYTFHLTRKLLSMLLSLQGGEENPAYCHHLENGDGDEDGDVDVDVPTCPDSGSLEISIRPP